MLWMLAACKTVPPPSPTPAAERVEVETRDGVRLVADAYRGPAGAPAILLLHMTPSGGWNRTDWPTSFIGALRAEGWWVFNLDRRGAGESDGVAEDAYLGEAGKYDAEAAALWLQDRGAGPLAIVGASNGTTTAVDYAGWPERPVPVVALAFLSGGPYTENQRPVRGLEIPIFFATSTEERAWTDAQRPDAPPSWVFHEYPEGGHGTHLFASAPRVQQDLVAFLRSVL